MTALGRPAPQNPAVWIIDASDANRAGHIELRLHPDADPAESYRNLVWRQPPAFAAPPGTTTVLDLGEGVAFVVGGWYERNPRRGYGWLIRLPVGIEHRHGGITGRAA